MPPVRRIAVDVLTPNDSSLVAFAGRIADLDGVAGANAALVELDREVQHVRLTVEGEDVSADRVEAAVEDLGGTLHSVDAVAVGGRVEERATPQD
jgi:hypothetical protein